MRCKREFVLLCRVTLEDGDAFTHRAGPQDVMNSTDLEALYYGWKLLGPPQKEE